MILKDLDKIVVEFDIESNGYSIGGGGGRKINLPCLALVSSKYLSKGFMNIRQAKKHIGLFFAFKEDGNNHMWMKDTYLPLDIIFLSKDGSIVEIIDGKPMDKTSIGGNIPCKWAIEVVKGFVKENGILCGQKISIRRMVGKK